MTTTRHHLLLLAFCFCNLLSFAQQSKTDSLLSLLKTDIADTNKLNHLNNLSWEYFLIGSYDSAMLYANTALQLNTVLYKEVSDSKMKYTIQKAQAQSYNNIGNVYSSQGNYPEALKNHFASLKIVEEIGDKNGIATSYNNIGSVYDEQGNYPEALKNHFASLKIKEEIGEDRKSVV